MTRRSSLCTMFAALGLVVWAGCSDSGSGGGGPLSREAFLERYAAIRCDALEPCCADDGHEYDERWCRSDPHFGVPPPELQFAYDEAAARRCLEEFRAARGSCGRPAPDMQPSCYAVIRPTAELGTPCTYAAECVPADAGSAPRCLPSGPGAPSTCVVIGEQVRAAAGEPCGASCATYGSYQSCTEQFGSAATCFDSDGLYCSPETGRCEPLSDVGAACVNFPVPTCRSGLYCHDCDEGGEGCDGAGVCMPQIPAGEPCDGASFIFGVCADGGVCEYFGCDATPADGARGSVCDYRCFVPKAEGEPCGDDPFLRFECADPLFCDPATRSCTPPQPEGASCTDFSSCESGLICARDTRTCSKQRQIGEPCAESIECVEYRCSADSSDIDTSAAAGADALGVCLPRLRTSPEICAEQSPGPVPTATATDVDLARDVGDARGAQ